MTAETRTQPMTAAEPEEALESHDKALTRSIMDGVFANVYGSLVGGVILTSFGLFLGANELHLGLLAALPLLTNVAQVFLSGRLNHVGQRKRLCMSLAAWSRACWIPVILSLLLLPQPLPAWLLPAFLVLFSFSSVLVSLSSVAWLAWISDLVDETIRGRFFARRNIFLGVAGMVAVYLGGRVLDVGKTFGERGLASAFAGLFALGLVAAAASLWFLKGIPSASPREDFRRRPSLREELREVLKDRNFITVLACTVSWSFAVHLASPFFTPYLLTDLRIDYTTVSGLAVLSAVANLLGMRVWGELADRVNNKPIIKVCGWIIVSLPLFMTLAAGRTPYFLALIYFLSGFAWAGYNLCKANLVLRLTRPELKATYISVYYGVGGFAAAVSPILAGAVGRWSAEWSLAAGPFVVAHYHFLFLASFFLRILAVRTFDWFHEPEEKPVTTLVRVLFSVRGLSSIMGFSLFHHHYLPARREPKRPAPSGGGSGESGNQPSGSPSGARFSK